MAAGCFNKEDRPRQCHPLGYGVMKGNYLHPLAKAFKGQVIYTKGSFRQMVEWNIKEESERRKATEFLSIDQVRGHLTPGLL